MIGVKHILTLVVFFTGISGCQIYKMDVKQGNYFTQSMVSKLKPNMTKYEVQKVMGTPLLVPLVNTERWDYYYMIEPGNGDIHEEKLLSLFFKGNKLKYYRGDWKLPFLPKG